MSTKRTRTASAAEPSSSPKKRASVESSEPNKIVTRGKRKLLDVDEEVIEKPKKSPKKASLVVAAVTRKSSKKIASDEAVAEDTSKPQKEVKKARVKATKVDAAAAHIAGDDEIKKTSRPKSVRVVKSVAVPVVVPLSPIPVVTRRVLTPASTSTIPSTITAPNRQDARKFYVAPEVDRSNSNEISSLAEQYWSTLSHCFSTIGPLFLFLVLVLYAVSALTGSQAIASIGLVYVFTFLIIMGTFYFATLPFIIVSNTISRLIFPNGTSNQRDLTRVAFLMLTIGVAFTLFQYGDTFFSEAK